MTIPMIAHAGPGPHGEPTNVTKLREIMFADDWPGYCPTVHEIPDGMGAVDKYKRYSHLALKYLDQYKGEHGVFLNRVFNQAFMHAVQFYESSIGLGGGGMLAIEECCLRLLEYPPGVGGEPHTDFDLFTLNLWRSHPKLVVPQGPMHVGELLEMFNPSRVATRHRVVSHETETQVAIVFFALPEKSTGLPDGGTMGEWLAERYARSRVEG